MVSLDLAEHKYFQHVMIVVLFMSKRGQRVIFNTSLLTTSSISFIPRCHWKRAFKEA